MAWQELREFLDELERMGELHRVCVEVDPVLEIAEITARVCTSSAGGKALLFERVKGSRFPVLTNLFGSYGRLCAALEVENLPALTRRVAELLQRISPDCAPAAGAALADSPEFAGFLPQPVARGACQEVVEPVVDLARYPFLKSWPGDGLPGNDGRFITLPLVFTRDPQTGAANCGIYLVQVFSGTSVGIRWLPRSGGAQHWRRYVACGERMPVAIVLGGDPALMIAAAAPLPEALDEAHFAGFLRGKPVEMVQCRTSGIMVPAGAELVIEGVIDPGETRSGGSFGNHTGFYIPPQELPVMRVTCVTRRSAPIFPATVIGPPPMEDCYLAKGVERLMVPFARLELPEIVDVSLPLEGIFHGAAIVSIHKRVPGQARKVMEALWNGEWLAGSRLIVVVDADLDVHDVSRTFWKILNTVDWRRDVIIAGSPGHAPFPFGGRLGIDATRKMPEEGLEGEWPQEVAMDEAVRELVAKRWREYGF